MRWKVKFRRLMLAIISTYIFISFAATAASGCHFKGKYNKVGTVLNGYVCHANGAWYKKQDVQIFGAALVRS